MRHRQTQLPIQANPEGPDGWLSPCVILRHEGVDSTRAVQDEAKIRFTPVSPSGVAETPSASGNEREPGVDPLALTRRSLAGLGLGGAAAAASAGGTRAQAGSSGTSPDGRPGALAVAPTSQAGLGPRLTLHAIDNAHGTPGAGLVCDLSIREGDVYRPIKTVITQANGRPAEPLLVDDALKPGRYEVLLHAAAYFAALGVTLPSPNFLDRVPIRFQIRDARQRYHLPVLFTPWGYSYYRGS